MRHRIGMILVCCLWILPSGVRGAEEGSFDSNGVKIHYLVEGRGQPVVLIHGFTANIQNQWAAPGVLKALARDYRVIALDNRGHGKSGKPHDPKQYGSEMAEDVVRLLDHLKIRKAHVVGYSMGAMIAAKLLVTHPDRLLSVTLGGAAGIREGQDSTFFTLLADSLEKGKGFGLLISVLTPPGKPRPTPEMIEKINQRLQAANDVKALAAVVRGFKGLAVATDKLKANRVPVLALIGADDPLKKGVDELKGDLANLRIVVIPGTDHMTAFVHPQFTRDLREFLAKQRPRSKEKVSAPAAPGR